MKLSLKNILNELGLKSQASPRELKHSEQQTRTAAIMKGVDQGKEEVQQSRDGTMYYKGGVLHRETGPAIVPHGASVTQLDGGIEMAKGGEYYLYGKRAPDFSIWHRHVEKLKQQRANQPEAQSQQQDSQQDSQQDTRQNTRPDTPPDTVPDHPNSMLYKQFQQGTSYSPRGPGGKRR